ncbi:hypothetical protein [Variovorax paradoxus]|uniref:hypothetical protein n=1 Tax=Variovorax paradoxus TaxID=34073 RepID=UPI002856891D|nr:hypothetical protein [Variovorax paradoxus]MDR6453875.1 hypothetical protein [Variovorax paradoxus]
MEVDPQVFETWKKLYMRWGKADRSARKARSETTVALIKCLFGTGIPPTVTQLDRTRELECTADRLRSEMDAKILSLLPLEPWQSTDLS